MKREPIVVRSLNRGDHMNRDELVDQLMEGDPAVTCLQEMNSEDATRRYIAERLPGFGIWQGDRPASEATPIVWNRDLFTVEKRICLPLLPAARRDGKFNVAKSLNAVRGTHRATGQRLIVFNVHQIQTVHTPNRKPAARKLVRGVADFGRSRRLPVVGLGDWNAEVDHDVMDPLDSWQWSQEALGKIATHGRRAIDLAVLRDPRRRLVFVKAEARHVPGTDHRRLTVTLAQR